MIRTEQILEALEDCKVDALVTKQQEEELAFHVAKRLNEQPADPQPVASGLWCTNCGFFEEQDDDDGVRCVACGCAYSDHIVATVVPA